MKYKNIFDSHAHYDDSKFDSDRNSLLASLKEAGICGIVNCGSDLESSKQSLQLALEYDYIYAAVGIHPHEAERASLDTLDNIKKLLKHKKVVAVGEIGLDYHYNFSPREEQREIFEHQIQFALEADLPIIIHDREAHEDTMNILKKYKPKGVVHCYSGSVEMAKELIKLGLHIGLGGAITFKNAKKPVDVAKFLPIEYLLIETDAPYMSPHPYRGKRCDSTLIPITAEKIAQIKKTDAQNILDITSMNANRLFDIKNK